MSFSVPADSYDRFMGRWSAPLAPLFADLAGVGSGQQVLDVGCGPGALTAELVRRVGTQHVAAVDPSEPFVAAARERHPGLDIRRAPAEDLPFADGGFDAVLAQLVVHFMADPVAGLREMARVARPDGVVAACVWDHGSGGGPLRLFWEAAQSLDPAVHDQAGLAGAREGHLAELLESAGLHSVESGVLHVEVDHPSFEAWWEPFTLGVGPAGAHVASLDEADRARLRERCRDLLPDGSFVLSAQAWAARGRS